MKTRLFTVAILLSLTTLFSACSEEEIYPQNEKGLTSTDGNGIAKYDEDF